MAICLTSKISLRIDFRGMENREYVRPQLRPNVCVWYIVGLFGACVLCDFIQAKYIDISRIAGGQRVGGDGRGRWGMVD